MTTARETMAAYRRAAYFSEYSPGLEKDITVTSGGSDTVTDAIVTVRSDRPDTPGRHHIENRAITGTATLNAAEVTLTETAAGNYGSITRGDGTTFAITEILSQDIAFIKVAIRRNPSSKAGHIQRRAF